MAAFDGSTFPDDLLGGASDDSFTFQIGELQNVDTVRGGGGTDTIYLQGQGPFLVNGGTLTDVRDIERLRSFPATSPMSRSG